ncbi:FtsX-like permease family protein [Rhodanobacter sp. DHB23]|uniref:ABC transporter permease n=1 Tax=Rhodanobacter sp. DHB23 TaxID=2775923 RepID=UPI00177DEF4D|nr:FtsX-like permease family protein [Rhodanobacter sp. DHB23]MBD8871542.1 ABC transporter permease [Rhodanobacter sp. DHB23]
MRLHPILAALRPHKTGVGLIALQIALTLAIVCNATFIIGQRMVRIDRPTGVAEAGLVRISQQWLDAPVGDDAAAVEQLDAMQRTDLAVLGGLPDVQQVAASASMPLQGMIWSGYLTLVPQPTAPNVQAAYYYGDEHLRSTLGLQLVAGRDFTASEIQHRAIRGTAGSSVVIVSQPVADALFPRGGALGKTIYQDGKPATIVGIVRRLQTPTLSAWGSGWSYNSVLEPMRLDGAAASYALRAKPGREQAVMREARKALLAVDPMRLMPDSWGVQPFSEIRAKVYRADRGMALLMGAICLILLCVTAAGIVGLTSFWVGQRRKQIGVRRALGARRIDILRYFQLENLFIAGMGAALGLLLAIGFNFWLMHRYALERLPTAYVLAGMVAMLLLGQAAVFVPARRASRVPPVVATRSV